MPKSVRDRIPTPVRSKFIQNYGLFRDNAFFIDWLLGRRSELAPPRKLFLEARVGGRFVDFRSDGLNIFDCLVKLGGLKPGEWVLEVGCGIGRNAVPLTKYLLQSAKYEGIDIVPVGIKWCQQRITRKYPNFRFQVADVFNQSYNPRGRFKASEFRFPFEDGSFDMVFLASVFTHMLPQDSEHYLSEIWRVLKSDGRCVVTFLLLNQESSKFVESGISDLKYESGPCRFSSVETPEASVAYQEEYVRNVFDKLGFNIMEPIHYGSWTGRTEPFNVQDLVIAKKGSTKHATLPVQ